MNTIATNKLVLITLNKRTLLNIMYTQNLLAESFNEILKQYDLSSEQFNVLKILQYQKGKPANMCDIQERMIYKTSNTTRLVDKLLLKGYVTREVCEDNRRKIEVFITKAGLEILKDLKPKMNLYEEKLSHNLTSKEFENLNYLLEKYRTT
ncbi:MarR family winged helix-turn-helix transcriptional regulator [Flavobacterium piscisymbiosum]|uniref:MarR family transcriptional regulator n=1 Tax=Flavobacterium piscisymbiosum TaxID=2893753 RepID=A0ABS8MKI1_9FLAO|nr:MarR family transcriptional regulator [Flavobacterium sp. F-30]MCC9065392.1 MarR family transcriptional regulator [Flavobacterium sp. F-30]